MMSQIYLEYVFEVQPLQPGAEILIAELAAAGFESFVETETGINAYIQKKDWDKSILERVRILVSEAFKVTYSFSEIEQINWNEEWEKNFEPIVVDETCIVRAPFHPETGLPYEIVIEPKMSFGTGHHETTFMMLQHLLENDLKGKKVLDMGCGTAVLAILAEKRGAASVEAIDNDPWCVENSEENVKRNLCKHIYVSMGDAAIINGKRFDVIIANINRNILLNDMETYVSCLLPEGSLYLSGFYNEDLPVITNACNNFGLRCVEKKAKNNWIAAKFVN